MVRQFHMESETYLVSSHVTPGVFVLGNSSLLISRVDGWSSMGMFFMTTGSFEDHFLTLKPARASRSDSWCCRCWALSIVLHKSNTSLTYPVSAASGKSVVCVFVWIGRMYWEQNGDKLFPNSNCWNSYTSGSLEVSKSCQRTQWTGELAVFVLQFNLQKHLRNVSWEGNRCLGRTCEDWSLEALVQAIWHHSNFSQLLL